MIHEQLLQVHVIGLHNTPPPQRILQDRICYLMKNYQRGLQALSCPNKSVKDLLVFVRLQAKIKVMFLITGGTHLVSDWGYANICSLCFIDSNLQLFCILMQYYHLDFLSEEEVNI